MRKKAESKIRQAVSVLENSEFYRIDKVRAKTDLIRKVFDKTILDMDRVRTIELTGGDTTGMSPSEIGNLIRQGERLHVYFKFLDTAAEPETLQFEQATVQACEPHRPASESTKPEKIEIVLLEVDPETWQRFENLCKNTEAKSPVQKIREMIRDYNAKEG